MIGTDGERESGKSMLATQFDDNILSYIAYIVWIYKKLINTRPYKNIAIFSFSNTTSY